MSLKPILRIAIHPEFLEVPQEVIEDISDIFDHTLQIEGHLFYDGNCKELRPDVRSGYVVQMKFRQLKIELKSLIRRLFELKIRKQAEKQEPLFGGYADFTTLHGLLEISYMLTLSVIGSAFWDSLKFGIKKFLSREHEGCRSEFIVRIERRRFLLFKYYETYFFKTEDKPCKLTSGGQKYEFKSIEDAIVDMISGK